MSTRIDKVEAIIFAALEALNAERGPDEQLALSPDTRLFGPDAVLDSLSLVSVMVDVETQASDEFGRAISLTDDRAMNRTPVPFTSVSALTAYIEELLGE
jgi:acyl carrier protein